MSITQQVHSMIVSPDFSIRDAKELIFKNEGLPIDKQFFIFKGSKLDDDRQTLKDCGIDRWSPPLTMIIDGDNI